MTSLNKTVRDVRTVRQLPIIAKRKQTENDKRAFEKRVAKRRAKKKR